MTERILGTPGAKRRRRIGVFAPLALLAIASVMLIAAAAAPALNTVASTYSIVPDDLGQNDEPGQKDLTLQGTNTSDMPAAINVLWNWDETSVGGGNTLDACTLFDTDGDGNANFSYCAIVGNISTQNKTLELKSTALYTCGDARNDRCSSQIALVTPNSALTPKTECGGLDPNSNTSLFPNGAGNPDTRIFCTVNLADVGATSAVLLNTCSYPSQQPNSDPSDCVLVPGRANPTIGTTPRLVPQDTATLSSNTNGSVTFELYKDAGTTPDGVCGTGDLLVFSQIVTSSGGALSFATTNSGNPAVNNGYSITTDGTYFWKANYSGDDDNNPAESACGVEKYVIDITP